MSGLSTRRLATRLAAVAITITLGAGSIGCFGKFNLTRNMYDINDNISENRWAKSGAFLAFLVFPVYVTSLTMDVVIFNAVEFWHRNPIRSVTTELESPDGHHATLTTDEHGTLHVTVERADGTTERFSLSREPSGAAAWAENGELLARVVEVNGTPTLTGGLLLE